MCKTVQNEQQIKKRKIDYDKNGALFKINKYTKRTVLCTISITIQFERP